MYLYSVFISDKISPFITLNFPVLKKIKRREKWFDFFTWSTFFFVQGLFFFFIPDLLVILCKKKKKLKYQILFQKVYKEKITAVFK